jgi:hypothetical protein
VYRCEGSLNGVYWFWSDGRPRPCVRCGHDGNYPLIGCGYNPPISAQPSAVWVVAAVVCCTQDGESVQKTDGNVAPGLPSCAAFTHFQKSVANSHMEVLLQGSYEPARPLQLYPRSQPAVISVCFSHTESNAFLCQLKLEKLQQCRLELISLPRGGR